MVTPARALLLAACLAVPALSQQSTRDTPRSTAFATLTGVVMSDARPPKALRRVRVQLTGSDTATGRSTVTADDGTFTFERLPPDEFIVNAAKDGYVAMSWGATRPGRPGRAIALRSGEAQRVTLTLPRGSVVTGRIVESQGEPVAGVRVEVLANRFEPWTGQRRLTPSGSPVLTDDRGVYRVFDLPAGDYQIVAHLFPSLSREDVLQVLSPQEIRRALAELPDTQPQAQPGPPRVMPYRPITEPRQRVGLAPVFYPGTAVPSQAVTLTLGPGEERTGVDFDVQYVRTATVSGAVPVVVGAPAPMVALIPQTEVVGPDPMRTRRTDPSGAFTFTGIPPGRYAVFARGGSRVQGQPSTLTWGLTEIVVDGEDVTDLALPLQPGLTISGRVLFTAAAPRRLAMPRFDLPIMPMLRVPFDIGPDGRVEADGRFSVDGVVPGVYRLNLVEGLRSPLGRLWLQSVIVNGRDLLDGPIELRQGTEEAVVTWSDRASDVSGVVTDARGAVVPGQTVILFATDRRAWFFNSRRIGAGRSNAQGRYRIRNLPAGDYYAIARSDIEENEWFDPLLLERAARGATTIHLEQDEEKIVNMARR